MPGNPQRTALRKTVDAPVVPAVARYRRRFRSQPWNVIGVVAAGGSLGAAARYGIGVAWPAPPGSLPWATFMINTLGCALIGVLMVMITEFWGAHPLVRPFLGTGVLGGFTTFSTYAVEIQHLVATDAPRTGLLYMVATPAAALAAVWVAVVITRTAMAAMKEGHHETHR